MYGSRTTSWSCFDVSGSTRPPADRCAAVDPAAGPIQSPLDFCCSSTSPSRNLYRDVAAGDAWQKSASLSTRAATTTPLIDTAMRVSTVRRSDPRSAPRRAPSTSPLLAPQKKPTECEGALLIARTGTSST